MKKVKILMGMITIIALSFTACQTDAVEETQDEQVVFETTKRAAATENNETVVKYNYSYNGQSFSLTHTVNNDSGDIVRTEGDTDLATSRFANSDGPAAVLFQDLEDRGEQPVPGETFQSNESYIELNVLLFDSVDEMHAEIERSTGERLPADDGGEPAQAAEGPCSSADVWGYGNFYYYKHAYYSTEMTSLRRTNRSYFRNHWVGSSNNDQMSSLIATKPYHDYVYTILYQHSCFNGRAIGFYQGRYRGYGFGVANLSWYRLSGWWWWSTSWNDQVSSIRGYSN